MKQRVLDILACPSCSGQFELKGEKVEDSEIKEGFLDCKECGKKFRIEGFIPRFVETDRYVDTFSFEWNRFHEVQIDRLGKTDESETTFIEKTCLTDKDVKGKLILDAGVGAGRFAEVVSRWGGEVVGIDLSFAVEAAYKNIGRRENVHIIQGDIFHLPFKKEVFDIVYSIGVLHHTPNTKDAFMSLVPFLKEKGIFAVYVYSSHNPWYRAADKYRKVTTRMPLRLVYYLSALAIPLYYVYKIFPFLSLFLPINLHPNPRWRWLDTFDWYTPKYQWKHTYPEVFSWFKEAGFENIQIPPSPHIINMTGMKKRRS